MEAAEWWATEAPSGETPEPTWHSGPRAENHAWPQQPSGAGSSTDARSAISRAVATVNAGKGPPGQNPANSGAKGKGSKGKSQSRGSGKPWNHSSPNARWSTSAWQSSAQPYAMNKFCLPATSANPPIPKAQGSFSFNFHDEFEVLPRPTRIGGPREVDDVAMQQIRTLWKPRGGKRAREAEYRAMKCCPDCSQCEWKMRELLDRELNGEEPASE